MDPGKRDYKRKRVHEAKVYSVSNPPVYIVIGAMSKVIRSDNATPEEKYPRSCPHYVEISPLTLYGLVKIAILNLVNPFISMMEASRTSTAPNEEVQEDDDIMTLADKVKNCFESSFFLNFIHNFRFSLHGQPATLYAMRMLEDDTYVRCILREFLSDKTNPPVWFESFVQLISAFDSCWRMMVLYCDYNTEKDGCKERSGRWRFEDDSIDMDIDDLDKDTCIYNMLRCLWFVEQFRGAISGYFEFPALSKEFQEWINKDRVVKDM